MSTELSLHYLFGGDRPWDSKAWTDSDDRVRGGRSQSHLGIDPSGQAEFHGTLDITALGGAGFASQRTTGVLDLDLSQYDGIVVAVAAAADDKKYTLTLKDEILPKRDDGRDQSTVSWEYDFVAKPGRDVVVRWDDFKATYRGKPKPDAKPLDRSSIKRVSFMMRSFFGEQAGAFSITVGHVAAFTERPGTSTTRDSIDKHVAAPVTKRSRASWKSWLCGGRR